MVQVLILLADVFLQLKVLPPFLENREHLLAPLIQLTPVVLVEVNLLLVGNVLTNT